MNQPWYKDGNIILRLAVVAAVVALARLSKLAPETAAAILMGLFGGTAIATGGGSGKKLLGAALIAAAIGTSGCGLTQDQVRDEGIKAAQCATKCAIQCAAAGMIGASMCGPMTPDLAKEQGVKAAQCLAACALQCGVRAMDSIQQQCKENEAILGGYRTTIHPAMVAVIVGGGRCSGVVVGPRTVLTAAHCVIRRPYAIISGERAYPVESIRIKGDFIWDRNNDLGVVRTVIDIDAKPLNIRYAAPMAGESVYIFGYGMDSPMGKQRQGGAVPSNRIGLSEVLSVSSSLFYFQGQSGVCAGDSGGAVISGGQLIGLTIRSIGDCSGKQGIAVRLDVHRGWLKEVL